MISKDSNKGDLVLFVLLFDEILFWFLHVDKEKFISGDVFKAGINKFCGLVPSPALFKIQKPNKFKGGGEALCFIILAL